MLDKGKSLILALQQDLTTNRPVELRNHITMFHELFFILSPDADGINRNMQRAFSLGDKSIYNLYNDLKEAGYYRRILSSNIVQQVVIDSIDCNFDIYPYKVTTFAQQIITRESNITYRRLTTDCEVTNCPRTDNNPHGFMIEKFMVINNDEIQKEKR